MSAFTTVRRRGQPQHNQKEQPMKYADQYQKLTEMGFDGTSVMKALESTQGNLENATAILLGEADHNHHGMDVEDEYEEKEVKRSQKNNNNQVNKDNKDTTTTLRNVPQEVQLPKDIKEAHTKMMSSYKVLKCKDAATHDKRMCFYWHSLSDRRRNPFESNYSCYDCPNIAHGGDCKDGDNCPHAHTMLEKMFHPDLFKISMCQRTVKGEKCDRGSLCAFAHNDEDLRIIPTNPNANLKTAPIPTKPLPDSAKLNDILEKILSLIKEFGSEGAFGSDIAKKFNNKYGEPLELEDEKGDKHKFRDIVGSHPKVTMVFSRGAPPKYVYDENKPVTTTNNGSNEEEQPSPAAINETDGDSNKLTEGQMLSSIRDRLVQVIKSCGSEGILGSDLPKKYLEMFGEKVDVTDESGSKMKLKDILSSQSGVTVQMLKLQPKYVYTAPVQESSPSVSKANATSAPVPEPKPLPPASIVVTGKSYSSVAKSFAKAAAAPEPVKQAQQPVHPPAAPAQQHHSEQQHHEPEEDVLSNAKAIEELVDESAPSEQDPIFTQDEELDRGIVEPSQPSYSDVTFGTAFGSFGQASASELTMSHEELLRKPEPASSTTAATLMGAPGLTKIHSQAPSTLDGTASLSSLIANAAAASSTNNSTDIHERLNLAQSQCATLQQQINKLQSELASRNNEYETQSGQLRAMMQRLAEAESKNNDEHYKLQLKSKQDEIAQKQRDLNRLEDDSRKVKDERKTDLNQFFINLTQIEDAIQAMKCKEEAYSSDKIRPEDINELLQFKKALRTFISQLKVQLKSKFDQITIQKPLEIESASTISTGVTASTLPGASMSAAAPRFVPNTGYDATGYYGATIAPRDAFAGGYVPYAAPPVETGLCALPGCKNQGHYTCAGCQRVSYCGAEHQRLHWVTHSMNCHP